MLDTSGNGKRGRDVVFSDAAIEFCLMLTALYNLPLRQAGGMVQSMLKLAGLDWQAPAYSTLCRRQRSLQVRIPYRRSDCAVALLVDKRSGSTGVGTTGAAW